MIIRRMEERKSNNKRKIIETERERMGDRNGNTTKGIEKASSFAQGILAPSNSVYVSMAYSI